MNTPNADNRPHPPRWAQRFLAWLHPEETLEEVEGDLDELYIYWHKRAGKKRATMRYLLNVLSVVPPFVRKRQTPKDHNQPSTLQPDMIRNYFKVAWRNIIRQKTYSILNIAGLSIAMASSILILLWVQNELSYDRFHANTNQLYRLTCSAGDFKAAVSPAGMVRGLQAEIPEIEATVRLSKSSTHLFEAGGNKFEEKRVFFADSNFLQFFSFALLQGNAKTAMSDPGSILLTQEMAEKYYGQEDALGKIIRINNKENFIVAGILANVPSNSHLQFDFILPMSALAKSDHDLKNDVWDRFNFYSYLQFNKNSTSTDIQNLIPRIQQIYKRRNPDGKIDFQLQPLTSIHLHSDLQIDVPGHGNIQYVNVFFIVALFILVVGCINFMNLSTAHSTRRAKEVGMRKVVGATRFQLVAQFLSEALIVSFVSLFIAIGIVYLLMPAFNTITEKRIAIHLRDENLWINLIGIALITGLISGSYPALFLSRFKPVKVLKGKLTFAGGNLLFRNGLVITQFVVAIILLISTAVVYNQMNFIKDKNLGFEKSNLLYTPMTGDMWNKLAVYKNALRQNPLTSNFSVISELPAALISGTTGVEWEGRDPKSQIVIPSIDVDENFIDVFKMKIRAGRSFSAAFKGDSSNYIINEKAMQVMGMNAGNAVGKSITFGGTKGMIIGVVKDFNFKSLQYTIEPLVLRLNKWGGLVMVRTQPGNTEATIKVLEKINRELNPAYPFTYSFFDKNLDNLYRSEQQMGSIFNLFAALAIFISCLGLYGLSAFMSEQRTKEIGVRKVLGASVTGVMALLSKDFLKLVLIAIVIASPIAWYTMDRWLQSFAYKIDIQWWVFALASLLTISIALLTVSFQSVKAALMNPVKSLRSE